MLSPFTTVQERAKTQLLGWLYKVTPLARGPSLSHTAQKEAQTDFSCFFVTYAHPLSSPRIFSLKTVCLTSCGAGRSKIFIVQK
jgi:hypothetical protein